MPIVVAVACVLLGGAAVVFPVPRPAAHQVDTVDPVRARGVDARAPAVGQPVNAGATVVARHSQTFDYVVLAVRDRDGRKVDFPGTRGWHLGSGQQVYASTRAFDRPGTYTYWFAYQTHGRWTNLGPRRTFTVVARGTGTLAARPAPRSAPSTAPATPVPAGVPGAWTYRFGDEFDGPIAWGRTWADSSTAESDGGHGNPGNQQLEWNHAANCATAGGILTMTAKPDSVTSPSGRHYDWSSCLITSTPSYAFRYGYIEIRAQLPAAKGFWPAFWTWQAPGNDQYTETDAFEFYSDNHARLYLTQHSGAGGGAVYRAPFDPSTGFHTYGVDIEPVGTRFYIDGKLAGSAPGTSTGLTNIIVDNFVYATIPPAAGSVGTMKVDYVRAWQH